MTARCICIDSTRCPRPAARTSGDIFVCTQHSTMWTMLLIDDRLAPRTRRMLAYARWQTVAAAQRLIHRLHARSAA